MTSAQIKYIVKSILGDNVDKYTPLENVLIVKLACNENVYPKISESRFKFDTSTELLKVIKVKKYSENVNDFPAHGNYDIIKDGSKFIVYEYYTDPSGVIISDTYSFNEVVGFIPTMGVTAYED